MIVWRGLMVHSTTVSLLNATRRDAPVALGEALLVLITQHEVNSTRWFQIRVYDCTGQLRGYESALRPHTIGKVFRNESCRKVAVRPENTNRAIEANTRTYGCTLPIKDFEVCLIDIVHARTKLKLPAGRVH